MIEVDTIASAMLEKKGKNVCSLDLKKIGTAITDWFVICNADSTTQVAAIADNIEERMIEKCGRKVVRAQGKENGFWVILDYLNVVVHIFQTEYRNFYRLEDLWADAARKDYNDDSQVHAWPDVGTLRHIRLRHDLDSAELLRLRSGQDRMADCQGEHDSGRGRGAHNIRD